MTGRFVILEHDHPSLHWDLLLEVDGAAATWRLLARPEPGRPIPAERLPDHRLLYLDYEGPVSGNRGQVKRVHSGTWSGSIAERAFEIELNKTPFATSAACCSGTDGSATWEFH